MTWRDLFLLLVLVISLVYFIGFQLEEEPFFPDEMSLIAQAYYGDLYFGIGGQAYSDPWNHIDWLRYPAYDHQPLTKYLITLGLHIGGVEVASDLRMWLKWLTGQYPRVGERSVELYWSRVPVVVMGTITCLIMFAIGTAFGGRWAGAGTALLIAWNPLFRTLSRRAMRDVPAECLVLLSVGIALWMWPKLFTKNGDWKKWVVFSVLEGIVIGLAVMTRLTGISAWVMVFLILVLASICWLYTRFKKEEGTDSSENLWGRLPSGLFAICTRLGIFVVLSLGTAAGVCWLVNPYLHASVRPEVIERSSLSDEEKAMVSKRAAMGYFGRLAALLEFRLQWGRESLESDRFDRFESWRLRSFYQRMRAVLWQGFGRYSVLGRQQKNWNHELKDRFGNNVELFWPCLYVRSTHTHRTRDLPVPEGDFSGLQSQFGFPCLWPALLFFPLTLCGWINMILQGKRVVQQGKCPVIWGGALYVAMVLVSLCLYLPWSWDRYFLPLVPATALSMVYATRTLVRWMSHGRKSGSDQRPSGPDAM